MMFGDKTFTAAAEHAFGFARRGELPSAVLAVADGRAVRATASCNADGRKNASLQDRIFALASITKAITGVGVARLVEEGVLRYSDRAAKFVPEFGLDSHRRRITIAHLLTHGSGLPPCPFQALYSGPYEPEETYKLTFTDDPLFDPGAGMAYASHTYQLVGEIIHRLLGLRMSAFLDRYVFAPCGMVDTGFSPKDRSRAMPVVNFPSDKEEDAARYEQVEMAGGGLWSTAGDLVRFAQAVLEPGRLMTPATFRRMTRPHRSVRWGSGKPTCRALGWVKETHEHFPHQPATGIYHGGATGTLLWLDPERSFIFVFLTNLWCSCNDPAFAVLDFFYRD